MTSFNVPTPPSVAVPPRRRWSKMAITSGVAAVAPLVLIPIGFAAITTVGDTFSAYVFLLAMLAPLIGLVTGIIGLVHTSRHDSLRGFGMSVGGMAAALVWIGLFALFIWAMSILSGCD